MSEGESQIGSSSSTSPTVVSVKIRWRWVILCAVVGLGGLLVAWWLKDSRDEFGENVAINISTSILLAGWLFVLEQAFVSRTRSVARGEAQQVATSVAEDAVGLVAAQAVTTTHEVAELRERLTGLEAEVSQRWGALLEQQDDRLAALSDSVAFDDLSGALRMAQELKAIGAEVIVPAGRSPRSPRVAIEYVRNDDAEDDLILRYVPVEGPRLDLGRVLGVGVRSQPEAAWEVDDDLADVFIRLKQAMVVEGHGLQANDVDPAFAVAALRQLITEAVSARRGDAGAWLSGATARELVKDDWVITDRGLEVQGHGVVAAKSDIMWEPAGPNKPMVLSRPPLPAWSRDSEAWEVAMIRLYTRRRP